MVLEYDFDIVTIDPKGGKAASAQSSGAVQAVFRDDRAAEALRAASPKIRWMFEDAGFGLETSKNDIPHGFYRPQDELDRDRILRILFTNIKHLGLKGEAPGEFDLWQFLDEIKTAQPQAEAVPEVQKQMPKLSTNGKPKRRSIQGRIGIALGLAVILIFILRYLAAAGVTP